MLGERRPAKSGGVRVQLAVSIYPAQLVPVCLLHVGH